MCGLLVVDITRSDSDTKAFSTFFFLLKKEKSLAKKKSQTKEERDLLLSDPPLGGFRHLKMATEAGIVSNQTETIFCFGYNLIWAAAGASRGSGFC